MKAKSRRPPSRSPWEQWVAAKKPIFGFGLKFCALSVLFFALSHLLLRKQPLDAYLAANARLSSGVLNLLGQRNSLSNTTIHSDSFAMTVDAACTAFEFVWFLCAAVLAFPAAFADRILGVLVAAAAIITLNLLRIVTLFVVGAHFSGLFEMVHVAIWPSVLVVATILLLAGWIQWTRRSVVAL